MGTVQCGGCRILLHICCAPCSVACIAALHGEGFALTGYWDNPNIHPLLEYRARRDALSGYADAIGLEVVWHGEYGLRSFVADVAGDIDGRCRHCYDTRMRSAAQYAAVNEYDGFTSTLFISPYQNHPLLTASAEKAAALFGTSFLYRDFRPLFREGMQKARELKLYAQKYCGCIFSEEERYQ